VAGNLRSRFADFLTTDGEKPDRNRDSEFEMPARASRAEIMRWWDSGWSVALASIDWVLVPGIGFDAEGRRVGYGGGYYDRLLPLLENGAARVAGAFDLQIVERVPAAPHDATVDAIVTERRTLEPPPRA